VRGTYMCCQDVSCVILYTSSRPLGSVTPSSLPNSRKWSLICVRVWRVENRLAQDAYKKHGDLHKQKNEDGKEVGGMKLILPSTTKLQARFRKSESPNSELGALTSTRHNAAVGWASPTIMLDSGCAFPLAGWGSTGSSVPNLSLYD
jgi:hypothetical protein